jgi:hypothetical protein
MIYTNLPARMELVSRLNFNSKENTQYVVIRAERSPSRSLAAVVSFAVIGKT